jgi:hypothetical protein
LTEPRYYEYIGYLTACLTFFGVAAKELLGQSFGPGSGKVRRRPAIMKSHKIFAALPPALGNDILEFSFASDKKLYRAALEAVAQARKVRTVFLERYPRTERNAMILSFLSRPALEMVSDNLLRAWLLKKHTAVLTDFLNALAIKHDNGVVEDLPKTVDDAALSSAIDTVLQKHPREVAAVYLHAFTDMNEAIWPNLDSRLQDDPRLALAAAIPS